MADILLSELTNTDIDWLAETGQQTPLSAGSQLSISKNTSQDFFYLLLDGKLSVVESSTSDHPATGQEPHELAQFESGEVIGKRLQVWIVEMRNYVGRNGSNSKYIVLAGVRLRSMLVLQLRSYLRG